MEINNTPLSGRCLRDSQSINFNLCVNYSLREDPAMGYGGDDEKLEIDSPPLLPIDRSATLGERIKVKNTL